MTGSSGRVCLKYAEFNVIPQRGWSSHLATRATRWLYLDQTSLCALDDMKDLKQYAVGRIFI